MSCWVEGDTVEETTQAFETLREQINIEPQNSTGIVRTVVQYVKDNPDALSTEVAGAIGLGQGGSGYIALAERSEYIERYKGKGNRKHCKVTAKGRRFLKDATT